MTEKALPWDKWFWSDYDADQGLRMCSLAAQGLWVRMLSLMARANPRGELRIGGEPCTVAELAEYVGKPEEMVASLIGELDKRGVFSRTRTGVIYNRKMRKQAEISAKRSRAGKIGAEATNKKIKDNPDLLRQIPGNASGKPPDKKPAPETRGQSSEDKSSGVPPAEIDLQKRAFDLAVEVLPVSEGQARSLAGKWRKVAGDQRLGDLLEQARGKADPVQWMAAAVNRQDSAQDEHFRAIELKYGRLPPQVAVAK